jgi:hypothetical protein
MLRHRQTLRVREIKSNYEDMFYLIKLNHLSFLSLAAVADPVIFWRTASLTPQDSLVQSSMAIILFLTTNANTRAMALMIPWVQNRPIYYTRVKRYSLCTYEERLYIVANKVMYTPEILLSHIEKMIEKLPVSRQL